MEEDVLEENQREPQREVQEKVLEKEFLKKNLEVEKKKRAVSEAYFLELDTLNIEEAASNAVPLTKLKNDTNSLVVILSWLEYLVKKVGIEDSRQTLRYYAEVLKWISADVFFDLDKYLQGMRESNLSENRRKVKC